MDTHPKLIPLMKAFEQQEDIEAIRLARELVNDPEAPVKLGAQQILASCLFAQKDFEAASAVWVDLFDRSEDPKDWVSVVTCSLSAKKFDQADRFFELAMKKLSHYAEQVTKDGSGWMPGMQTGALLHYYYAGMAAEVGAPERSLAKIKVLAEIYAGLVVTDAHFLQTRGAPTFQAFLKLLRIVYPPTASHPMWLPLWNRLGSALDDDGRSELHQLRKDLAAL